MQAKKHTYLGPNKARTYYRRFAHGIGVCIYSSREVISNVGAYVFDSTVGSVARRAKASLQYVKGLKERLGQTAEPSL